MNHLSYPNALYPVAGDVISQTGDPNVVVTGLQRYPVLDIIPTNGDVLVFQQNDSPFVYGWTPMSKTGNNTHDEPLTDGTSLGNFIFCPQTFSVSPLVKGRYDCIVVRGVPN
jgi:hypothetical protein